jgi:hypothetical protein
MLDRCWSTSPVTQRIENRGSKSDSAAPSTSLMRYSGGVEGVAHREMSAAAPSCWTRLSHPRAGIHGRFRLIWTKYS